MDNPLEVFALGVACGAGIVPCILFAFWMHRKDSAQTPLRQSQTAYVFDRLMILGFVVSLACVCIGIAGALTLPGGVPTRLIWSAGVVLGIIALLMLQWIQQERLRRSGVLSFKPRITSIAKVE